MCADLSGGTWLPLPLSLFFFSPPPYHVEERESKAEGSRAAMQSSHAEQAVRWPSTTSQCAGMPCAAGCGCKAHAVLVHLLPPRRPLHLLLITAFPFPLFLSLPHTTTKKVSAPPCSRASTHAMAAMGDGVVCVGRGSNRREEKRKHNISLTHTCTTCCMCGMQVEEDMSCWWW